MGLYGEGGLAVALTAPPLHLRMDMRGYTRLSTPRGFPQLTLGQFLKGLTSINADSNSHVVFDFEYAYPTRLRSWRGAYEEIAFGFTSKDTAPILLDIIHEVRGSIGSIYEGYKGGLFMMKEDTPVWVSNYGHAGHTAIIGVFSNGYQVIIETAYCEF